MSEEMKATTPPAETPPAGNAEAPKAEEKTFTQAELDTIITERLNRAVKDAPSKEEMEAYRLWKESQQSETEKINSTISKANKERDEAASLAAALERKVEALSKGIPADKVDKYAKLAEAYAGENVSFDKALDCALKDFPIAEAKPTVPGSGGNPPSGAPKHNDLPKGTVIF